MRTLRFALCLTCLAAMSVSTLSAQPVTGQIGNLNEPVGPSVPNILFGDQTFAYLVFPDQQISCPGGGFALEQVQMLLDFTENQVPATLQVAGGLLTAVEEGSGYVPGDEVCYSDAVTITITEPGINIISVPTIDSCGTLPIDIPYFLSLRFLGDAVANLAIDDEPAPGIEFLDGGNGFFDMYNIDRTSGGKVIIWGDIVCRVVVGTEASSWGAIKTLFR